MSSIYRISNNSDTISPIKSRLKEKSEKKSKKASKYRQYIGAKQKIGDIRQHCVVRCYTCMDDIKSLILSLKYQRYIGDISDILVINNIFCLKNRRLFCSKILLNT